jgi:L-aminopeptidase/D-esterase-like protein
VFEQTFKNIDDVLWKEAGCATELDYTEQTSWILFLKYLDDLERANRQKAELSGKKYEPIIDAKHRWSVWAAPKKRDGMFDHDKALTGDDLIEYVDGDLFPYLKGFRARAEGANTIEYKIGEIFSEIENKFRSGYSLRDALELVDQLSFRSQQDKHELSYLYEAKLRNMGNAGRNGGEYYTPRPLIRAMIHVVKPQIGERIYDGACGSAGFLCEAFDYLRPQAKSTDDFRKLQAGTFHGKEKKSLAYVIGIMNMILHGIKAPNIVHTARLGGAFLFSGLAAMLMASAATGGQDHLVANTAINGPVLSFDWPAVEIGIGSYEEGPTGLTVFRFPNRVSAAVDVRGGAPGTINTDVLRLGYSNRFVDAVVLAGGSDYGEEATTAVMTGLLDDGSHNGEWDKIAFAAGAIIYDLLDHRLNDIYPDKRLAQAALHDLRTGVFPLGAQGAGRSATQGSLFGCGTYSGQGGAFRQIGDTKVAAFTVVNALGVVTDREGRIVRCHRDPAWGNVVLTAELLAHVSAHKPAGLPGGPSTHTTISLVVTNRQMSIAELQRLAVEVHTSMARGIQPLATPEDGDALFAVSTQEVAGDDKSISMDALYIAAGEAMWDAILASVPEEPALNAPVTAAVPAERLEALAGQYRFGRDAVIEISIENGKAMLRISGRSYLDLTSAPIALTPMSPTEFYVESRYHTRIAFTLGADGKATAATINPGRWAMHGDRIAD